MSLEGEGDGQLSLGGEVNQIRPNRRTRFTSTISSQNQLTPRVAVGARTSSSSTTMLESLSLRSCRRTFSAQDLPHTINNFAAAATASVSPKEVLDDSGIFDEESAPEMPISTEEEKELNTDEEEAYLDKHEDKISPVEQEEDKRLSTPEVAPLRFVSRVELLEENLSLKERIDAGRKDGLKKHIVSALLLEAWRREQQETSTLRQELEGKREEVAARKILHSLLLNSWRITNGELNAVSNENSQLHKTIDNLCLQLRVVRHLQSTEKEKSVTRAKQFEGVKAQLAVLQKENTKIRIELDKVSSEREGLFGQMTLLKEEEERISAKYRQLKQNRSHLSQCSELNRKQADSLTKENQLLLIQVEELREELKTLTSQSAHWQEKTRSFESECWELKLTVETKDNKILKLISEQDSLHREKETLKLSKQKTEEKLEKSGEILAASLASKKETLEELALCQSQLGNISQDLNQINQNLNKLKQENCELREELYSYTLKNVRKRRVWGVRALFFIFNPFALFKYWGEGAGPHPSQQLRQTTTNTTTKANANSRAFNAQY